jgi:hypothetical protein
LVVDTTAIAQARTRLVPASCLIEARLVLVARRDERVVNDLWLIKGRIPESAVYISLNRVGAIPLMEHRNARPDYDRSACDQTQPRSAYDAAYLDLALHERTPLATLDKRLAAAGRAEKVEVLGPHAG